MSLTLFIVPAPHGAEAAATGAPEIIQNIIAGLLQLLLLFGQAVFGIMKGSAAAGAIQGEGGSHALCGFMDGNMF